MKHVKSFIFIISAGVFLQCSNPQAQSQNLEPHAFLKTLESTAHPLLVDVRSPEEFKEGHLKSAINMDWNGSEFKTKALSWDRNQVVFVYCLSGGRSASAAEYLRTLPFKNVIELRGGLMAWRAAKLPEQDFIKKAGLSYSKFVNDLQHMSDSVLVDFYADWCKPCQRMKPGLEQIQKQNASRITLWRIDADANSELCRDLKIDALPVLQLYIKGKNVWEHRGFIEPSTLREVLHLN